MLDIKINMDTIEANVKKATVNPHPITPVRFYKNPRIKMQLHNIISLLLFPSLSTSVFKTILPKSTITSRMILMDYNWPILTANNS